MVVYVFQVADCKFSQNSLFHGSNCQKLGIFTDFFYDFILFTNLRRYWLLRGNE